MPTIQQYQGKLNRIKSSLEEAEKEAEKIDNESAGPAIKQELAEAHLHIIKALRAVNKAKTNLGYNWS